MPFATVNHLDFYYETAGNPASPPLLLIAGLSDYTSKWDWQVADLSADFFVITFDNRCAGRSVETAPGFGMAQLGDDAAGLLDALGVNDAHVFGISMGGMIALNLTVRHPERVRRLALGCTTAGSSLTVPPSEEVMAALLSPPRSGDPRRDFVDGCWMSLGPGFAESRPDVVGLLADQAAANPQSPSAYAAQIMAIETHDVVRHLGDIRVPTLVLHGEADVLVPVENGRLLAERIPGAELIIYPGAGHLFFVEQSKAVNRDLRAFFNRAENT